MVCFQKISNRYEKIYFKARYQLCLIILKGNEAGLLINLHRGVPFRRNPHKLTPMHL